MGISKREESSSTCKSSLVVCADLVYYIGQNATYLKPREQFGLFHTYRDRDNIEDTF